MTRFNVSRLVVFSLVTTWIAGATRADEPKKQPVLESLGYLVPVQQVSVSPVGAGKVKEMLVREGQQVKKDEVLARLERYELDVFAEEDEVAAQAAIRTAEVRAAAQGQAASSSASSAEPASSATGSVSSREALELAARRVGRRKAVAQASLFDLANQKVVEEIRAIDPVTLSPEEAKELLRKLREQMV